MPSARDKYGPRLDAIPALARFCDEAEVLVRADDPDTMWELQPLFQDLLSYLSPPPSPSDR